jgi:hypothetical protein
VSLERAVGVLQGQDRVGRIRGRAERAAQLFTSRARPGPVHKTEQRLAAGRGGREHIEVAERGGVESCQTHITTE